MCGERNREYLLGKRETGAAQPKILVCCKPNEGRLALGRDANEPNPSSRPGLVAFHRPNTAQNTESEHSARVPSNLCALNGSPDANPINYLCALNGPPDANPIN